MEKNGKQISKNSSERKLCRIKCAVHVISSSVEQVKQECRTSQKEILKILNNSIIREKEVGGVGRGDLCSADKGDIAMGGALDDANVWSPTFFDNSTPNCLKQRQFSYFC